MVQMERRWVAVDADDRIIARGRTRDRTSARLIWRGLDPSDYEIVAIPKVNPPVGVGWGGA